VYVIRFENRFVKEDHETKIDEGCLIFLFENCIIMGEGMIFKSKHVLLLVECIGESEDEKNINRTFLHSSSFHLFF